MSVRTWSSAVVCFWITVSVLPLYGAESVGGDWVNLFNGRDLTGWKLVNPKGKSGWIFENGVIINQTPSTNIYTEKQFKDFDLHCDYQIPPRSNAGIYILNRYEVQIFDDYQRPIHSHMCGSLYGEITPTANACKPPAKNFPKIEDNEWQTFDISFRAARYGEDGAKIEPVRVTVIHNGVKIIDNAELKTPTGAARRFDEEAMGPILLQADHGPVAYRNFRIRGQMYDPPDPKAPSPMVIGLEAKTTETTENKATGLALRWRTPNNAFAPSFSVYRGESADFALDKQHLVEVAVKRSVRDFSFPSDGTYFYRVVALGPSGVAGKPSDAISAPAKANQVRTPSLSDASWARIEGENKPARNRAANNKPMAMQQKKFEKGIGVQGATTIQLNVGEMIGKNNDYRFRATVGMDDSTPANRRDLAAARFVVEANGKTIFDSGKMKWADGTKDVDVAVPAGTAKLALIVRREGQRGSDNASWGDPRLERVSR